MHHRAIRVTLTTCLMLAISAVLPGASSTLLADCPTPSFVKIVKRQFANGPDLATPIDSRTPGVTITLNYSNNLLTVWHAGDVQPGSNAVFNYRNVATGVTEIIHATNPSQSNGVIHHEFEGRNLGGAPPGTRYEVVASWMDECGAGPQVRPIGFVELQF